MTSMAATSIPTPTTQQALLPMKAVAMRVAEMAVAAMVAQRNKCP
jgi:ApbE superfamily uncharacterized protein (UPF0280 family)